MPATAFDRLPDDARLWVFAASRDLTTDEAGALLGHVDGFLERWAAHGTPVVGARELRHGRFLLVAADERATGVSGCSIDSLFHSLAAACDAHPAHGERHAEPLAKAPAECRPAPGIRAQSMVDVRRADAGKRTRERVQQHDRIDAAGEPDEDALACQFRCRPCDGGGDVSAPGLP